MPQDAFEGILRGNVELTATVQGLEPETGFLTRRYFGDGKQASKSILKIERRRKGNQLAVFVHPSHQSVLVEEQGKEFFYLVPPAIDEKMKLEPEEVFDYRGDHDSSYVEAMAQLHVEKLEELKRRVYRNIEWQAASMMRTGAIQVAGHGVESLIDMNRNPGNTIVLSGNGRWGESGASIRRTLSEAARVAKANGGVFAQDIILGSEAAELLLADTRTAELLDNRRTEIGDLVDQDLVNYVRPLGRLYGFNLFEHIGSYVDEKGNDQKYIPDNEFIACSPNTGAELHFGQINNVKWIREMGDRTAGMRGTQIWARTFETTDPSAEYINVQAAPVTVAHNPEAFVRVVVR